MLTALLLTSELARAARSCEPGQALNIAGATIAASDASCRPFKVGESRAFRFAPEASPTNLPVSYEVKRAGEHKFEVHFAIAFQSDEHPGVDDELNRKWHQKTAQCLKSFENRIRSSAGDRFDFKLVESGLTPTPVAIKSSGRADSEHWSENVSCGTILHEMLHLSGLIDEYPEEYLRLSTDASTGQLSMSDLSAPDRDGAAYNCRKTHDDQSLMAETESSDSATSPYQITSIFCECGDPQTCKRAAEEHERFQADLVSGRLKINLKTFKAEYPLNCPRGYKPSQFTTTDGLSESMRMSIRNRVPLAFSFPKGLDPDRRDLMKVAYRVYRTPHRAKSAFEPLKDRHFSALLYPGCLAKNLAYYEEAQNAYRTSETHGGEGCFNFVSSGASVH